MKERKEQSRKTEKRNTIQKERKKGWKKESKKE